MAKCYKYVTVVNDQYVLLGRRYDYVLVIREGDGLRLVGVEKRKLIRVRDVLGKECATRDDLLEIAKKLLGGEEE